MTEEALPQGPINSSMVLSTHKIDLTSSEEHVKINLWWISFTYQMLVLINQFAAIVHMNITY